METPPLNLEEEQETFLSFAEIERAAKLAVGSFGFFAFVYN